MKKKFNYEDKTIIVFCILIILEVMLVCASYSKTKCDPVITESSNLNKDNIYIITETTENTETTINTDTSLDISTDKSFICETEESVRYETYIVTPKVVTTSYTTTTNNVTVITSTNIETTQTTFTTTSTNTETSICSDDNKFVKTFTRGTYYCYGCSKIGGSGRNLISCGVGDDTVYTIINKY